MNLNSGRNAITTDAKDVTQLLRQTKWTGKMPLKGNLYIFKTIVGENFNQIDSEIPNSARNAITTVTITEDASEMATGFIKIDVFWSKWIFSENFIV